MVASLLQSSVETITYPLCSVVLFARCNPRASPQRSVCGILPERGMFSATFTDVLLSRAFDPTRNYGMVLCSLTGTGTARQVGME